VENGSFEPVVSAGFLPPSKTACHGGDRSQRCQQAHKPSTHLLSLGD
jgi:hypothetical protein